ncbi:hypothetical protein J3A64_002279 [Pseudarthrobacter sp. PvP004]|nr:hypothetical protein [Pseudarthrobacter sp. PvP004]
MRSAESGVLATTPPPGRSRAGATPSPRHTHSHPAHPFVARSAPFPPLRTRGYGCDRRKVVRWLQRRHQDGAEGRNPSPRHTHSHPAHPFPSRAPLPAPRTPSRPAHPFVARSAPFPPLRTRGYGCDRRKVVRWLQRRHQDGAEGRNPSPRHTHSHPAHPFDTKSAPFPPFRTRGYGCDRRKVVRWLQRRHQDGAGRGQPQVPDTLIPTPRTPSRPAHHLCTKDCAVSAPRI